MCVLPVCLVGEMRQRICIVGEILNYGCIYARGSLEGLSSFVDAHGITIGSSSGVTNRRLKDFVLPQLYMSIRLRPTKNRSFLLHPSAPSTPGSVWSIPPVAAFNAFSFAFLLTFFSLFFLALLSLSASSLLSFSLVIACS